MEKTLQLAELVPNAPLIVPPPFTAATLYLNAGREKTEEVETFLDDYAVEPSRRETMWLTMVFDKRFSGHAIAQAAYAMSGSKVSREALFVHPLYAKNDFAGFFDNLGSSLFGNAPVLVPVSDDEAA